MIPDVSPTLTSTLLGHTIFLVMGGLVVISLFALPMLRALGMLLASLRWLGRAIPRWLSPAAVDADPIRTLRVDGLSPALAKLAQQTRTLALELRRRSEQARHWPEDAADLEAVRVAGWRGFLGGELGELTPLIDTRREVWDWLRSAESLAQRDAEALAGLGVEIEALRQAVEGALEQRRPAEAVRALAGLLWSIDERFSDAGSGPGYRASGAQLSSPLLRGSGLSPRFDTDDEDEAELAARRRQLSAVLHEHGRGLSQMAASYGKNASEREDLEQDIALALWRALPGFRGESSLRTFVHRVARYCCYRQVRRRRPAANEDPFALADPQVDPEGALLQADARAQVRAALAELPDSLESTLSLHLSGLSYAEIAERLGISERNVSVRLTRARKRLRSQVCAA